MEQLTTHQEVRVDERGVIDLPFLVLTVLLVLVGVLTMFSASFARAYMTTGNSAYYFVRQAIFAGAGVTIMIVVSRVDYQSVLRRFTHLILLASVALLVVTPFVGENVKGATRWINIFGIQFQPSEVAKVAVVMTFASMISMYKEKMETFRYGVVPFAGVLGVVAGLLYLQPHLSATLIILVTGAVMMFLGGTRLRWFIMGIGLVGLLFVLYLATQGYAGDRLAAWQDPFSDPSDKGYQTVQSLYAIGSGGLSGLGLGRGRQKYLYLPEEHNDYIFAVWCEEMGFIGAVALIALFVLLICRGYWISMRAKDRFGALLAAGFTTLILIQVFLNIAVVTNFIPPTGVSLPFFSYGGTAILVQLFEMGVILNISRQNPRKRK